MDQLKTPLQALVNEVCQTFGNTNMPMRTWTSIVRKDAQTTSFPEELRIDSLALQISLFRISDKLDSLQQLANVVDKDPRLSAILAIDASGKPIFDAAARHSWLLTHLVVPFLVAYFVAKKEFLFDQEVFDATLKRFSSMLESPITRFTSISPLLNLRLAVDSIEVAPGLRIRKLASQELEVWLNSGYAVTSGPGSSIDLLGLDCAVDLIMEEHVGESLNIPMLTSWPTKLVDVLRLYTNSDIYILFTQQESREKSRPLHRQALQSWSPSLRLHKETSIIDASDGKRLAELWHRLDISSNARAIELAFRRWSMTAERLSDEDKLIDYWVALESLFTSDSSQEVTFRASLRIAAFLGETPGDRQKIYTDMRHSYSWRSAIVHGDTSNKGTIKRLNKKGTLHVITSITRSYLRTTILRLIELKEVFDPSRIELQLLHR